MSDVKSTNFVCKRINNSDKNVNYAATNSVMSPSSRSDYRNLNYASSTSNIIPISPNESQQQFRIADFETNLNIEKSIV